MTTPRTELDTRFSEPAAQPTSWEDTLEAIKQAEIFWISTVRADGRPHVTPLVAVWLDDALHFSTGPGEQKARNLASNPRVALTTGANDWQRGLDVVVEGDATRVTDAQQLDRLAAAWAQKWDGRWQYEVSQDGFRHAFVFTVRPAKVLAFTKAASATPDIASEAAPPHFTRSPTLREGVLETEGRPPHGTGGCGGATLVLFCVPRAEGS